MGDRASTTSVKHIQGNKTDSDVKSSKAEPCHRLICSCVYLRLKIRASNFKDRIELFLLKHITS